MDSLTHGLLGLAIGVLHKASRTEHHEGTNSERVATERAVLLGCVIAAELPDLDYLIPAADPILHTLKSHRGFSHSLCVAPVVALAATLLSKLVFRAARLRTIYPWTVVAVIFAHLCADAWTGWGTRLLLPFSDARVTLDWMMVIDPLFTLPLLIGALIGWRRKRLRQPLLVGLAISLVYLAGRITAQQVQLARVRDIYPNAQTIAVFPSWFGPSAWRYVAVFPTEYRAGKVTLFSTAQEEARHARENALTERSINVPTVREALAWARFPVISQTEHNDRTQIRIGDLRYHLNGSPTLTFMIELDQQANVVSAKLHRGGSARSLIERFRGSR